MIEATEYDKYYYQYEYDVVQRYLIPLLLRWGVKLSGSKLLDVGCGDGGGLAAVYDAGMICKGFDIEQRRVDLALTMNHPRTMTLCVGNIYNTLVPFDGEQFDLVVLHDVFEHLEQKEKVLQILKSYLAPNGRLFITFPPYYSAFGGHQQLMKTWFIKLPFAHLVPFVFSGLLPRLQKEHRPFVNEVRKLAELKMGMRKFEQLLPNAGLMLVAKQGYVISPNHVRFGLKPIPSNLIANIPVFGELLTSGAVYLLSRT